MDRLVLVLGNTVTALSTLRALKGLKKEGYTIMFATTCASENIALRSNIPVRKFILKEGLLKGLLRLGETFISRPVLLFTRDDELLEASRFRKMLEPYYSFLLPSKETVEMLMAKGEFTRFAKTAGLSIPKTEFITCADELLDIHRKLSFPIILKPYLRHAIRLDRPDEIAAVADSLGPLSFRSMIAQEYIRGEDDNLYFIFLLINREGETVHRMVGRKLRQWPLSYGTTSLAVTVDKPGLLAEVRRFVEATDIRGYCSIEYKYDELTDSYVIMEPTIGRFNQQIALSTAGGVNFPEAMVRMLNGEKVSLLPQKNNVRWIYESNDWFAYRKARSTYGYINNFMKPGTPVLFSLSDPLPVLYEIYSLGRKRLKKILRYG